MTNNMHNYDQPLPDFDDLIRTKEFIDDKKTSRHSQEQSVQTILSSKSSSSSSTSSSSSSAGSIDSTSDRREISRPGGVLFNLPPVLNNSALVRQRVSAKDTLAAASLTTGASLPLMIGGRSKCVVNILQESEKGPRLESSATNNAMSLADQHAPKNTASRAEQRKQNMVSVVRPVVNNSIQDFVNGANGNEFGYPVAKQQTISGARAKLEHSPIWAQTAGGLETQSSSSVIDEFMMLENKLTNCHLANNLDDLIMSSKLGINSANQCHMINEQQARQQMLLFRREEYELNKSIKKQHRFVLSKMEERKRNLQIIQAIWFQKNPKHAIGKLVDIYQQGLVFTSQDNPLRSTNSENYQSSTLNSLNSSLVVDVISIIILRPKLWDLEICQLLLPIIVNDLLTQKLDRYSNYVEVALKSIKFILTHFSSVIKKTLESRKETEKSIGVELNLEERIKRASNCYKLLMDSKTLVAKRCQQFSGNNKFATMFQELNQSLTSFQSSIQNH